MVLTQPPARKTALWAIPVSDLAKKGADLPPLTSRDSSYADALPASQVCG